MHEPPGYPGENDDPQTALFPGGSPLDRQPRAPITVTQRKVLARLREDRSISPAIAGTILHEHRGHCGSGAKGGRYGRASSVPGRPHEACCAYASSDGLEVLKRLVARGAVAHTARGRYEPLPMTDWQPVDGGEIVPTGMFERAVETFDPTDPIRDAAVAAREEAIARVDRGMDEEWRERALAKLHELCVNCASFQIAFICDDLRAAMGDDEPREPRAYGTLMRRAHANGWCRPLDQWRVSDRVSNHKRPERVWTSTL